MAHDASFPLLQPPRQPQFDLRGFDEAIYNKGVRLAHYRAMPCPGGLDSRTDARRPHPDHLGCSGGFLFSLVGTCRALFTSNSTSQRGTEPGIVGSSSGSVTFARFYDEDPSARVRVCQYDRLYLPDEAVLAESWELFDHIPGRPDRLTYPVLAVVGEVVDRFGTKYLPGDFSVVDGNLAWGGREPPMGPDGRGTVCSVRYTYRPYWYVQYMSHDLRLVTQARLQPDGGTQQVVDVYQAAQVQREYFFRSEDRDQESGRSRQRQVDPPSDLPRFGPR